MKLGHQAAAALVLSSFQVSAAQTAPPHDVVELGRGVHAVIRHDPEAFANNANSMVVVGDDGVLVVDAQFTRLATLQTLAAIRGLTSKPVRFVVNTHWHDDHVAGNQVYRDSFPNVVFIAHASTRADLATIGASNRTATWDAAGPYVARLERLMAQGLGGDSTPISPMERTALQSTVSIIRQYVSERSAFRETLPTLTFDTHLTVYLGTRAVDLRYFGRGNTRGDAVVSVPDVSIVATGDLLDSPMPFGFNAYVSDWIGALDSLQALHAVALVPGHGAVQRDNTYLQQVSEMLRTVKQQTDSAVAAGASLADVQKKVRLTEVRQRMTQGEKWMSVLFTSFFLNPVVARAFEEASTRKR